MNVGDKVRITKCDMCSKIVGKIGTVTKLNTELVNGLTEVSSIKVKFGRGRPQKNRPNVFVYDDVVVV